MFNEDPEYKKVVELLNTAKNLSAALNHAIKEKNDLEEDFLKKNQGKEIVLIAENSETKGILENINRFRIEIKTPEGIKYFCKTGIVGFYAKG